MQVIVTSPWVPFELIQAYGLQPAGPWSGMSPQSRAVPEGVCAFAQGLLDGAAAPPHTAMVFTTVCDQMRRAADASIANSTSPVFLFNLPATWQSPAARHLYHAELARLGRFLERLGGRPPAPEHLWAVIQVHEMRRAALRDLIQRSSARLAAEAMMNFYCEGRLLPSPPERVELGSHPVRLALVGGPLLPSQWPLFDGIESAGGCVVLNATEPGERCLPPPLPSPRPHQPLLATLADHYFDHAVDVFHRPNSRLYAWLAPRLTERRVRGLLLWAQVNCDLWRAEAASLRVAFSLPVLPLDAQQLRSSGPRDTNRLAAFVESLQ